MKIFIKVKELTAKDLLIYQEYETNATTVNELILEMVEYNVASYNKKRDSKDLFLFSEETLKQMADSGKVSFGGLFNKRKVDVQIMQDEAILQFKTGRFKLINETTKHEYKTLDELLLAEENHCFIFLQLTFIKGRW